MIHLFEMIFQKFHFMIFEKNLTVIFEIFFTVIFEIFWTIIFSFSIFQKTSSSLFPLLLNITQTIISLTYFLNKQNQYSKTNAQ